MNVNDFKYELPEHLIAQYPLAQRSASRLLALDGKTGAMQHLQFNQLIDLLEPNDLLVFNNSRVIPARIYGTKATGGKIEMLVERIVDSKTLLVHMRSSKSPKPGSLLLFADNIQFEVLGRQNDLYELRLISDLSVLEIIEKIGQIPLPSYMQRVPETSDLERYQTIYAKHKGSVAAPTAGLHFDHHFFEKLAQKNIQTRFLTLHVGAGTFAPVKVENIQEHQMHAEYLEVSSELCDAVIATKEKGGRVIAVGTTSARSLETACSNGTIQPFSGYTNIFIYPSYQFKCVDAMVTNLHVPCSTLIMLVCAFAGYEHVMAAYHAAVQQEYRFYSYGDAMFVTRG